MLMTQLVHDTPYDAPVLAEKTLATLASLEMWEEIVGVLNGTELAAFTSIMGFHGVSDATIDAIWALWVESDPDAHCVAMANGGRRYGYGDPHDPDAFEVFVEYAPDNGD